MKSKKEIISGFGRSEEESILLAGILDKYELCRNKNVASFTKFLSLEEQTVAKSMLCYVKAECFTFGGREGCERALLCFLPDYLDADCLEHEECPISAIEASFKSPSPLTHRDFLGSLMGLGLKREAVGDILVEENICRFFVLREVCPFVLQNMTSAGKASLTLREIPLSEVPATEQRFEEKRASVMSMRLDGVVSEVFNVSRDTAAQLVKAGKVSLNHLTCEKGDRQVPSGSIISVKGLGKAEVYENGTLSKRGRISITVKKYV